MKKFLLYFVIAFLLGFVGFAIINRQSSHVSTLAPATTARSNTGKHVDDSFSEYESMMLDDEEKTTMLIGQANDLNSLLGLAEKFWTDSGEYNRLADESSDLIQKIAKMYPAQALRYYATLPSNVTMNQLMSEGIIIAWVQLDFSACLAYLDHDENLPINKFCETWSEFVRNNLREKSAESALAFAKLSRAKQQALMENFRSDDEIALALLPVINDPVMLAQAQQMVEKAKESAQPQAAADPEVKKEQERIAALVEQYKTSKPEPQQVTKILDGLKWESDRSKIFDVILEPSLEEQNNTPLWLARLSAVLANVNEPPPYPPDKTGNAGYEHQEELELWLPTQSPRLQRAWADNLIDQQSPEDAMTWIDQLSTASLRSDMREHVIQTWTDSDPQEAAQYIVTKSTTEEQGDLLPQAVYAWALNDFASARKWLEAQTDSPAKTAALKKLEK